MSSQLEALLKRIVQRLIRRLVKEGLLVIDAEQPWLDLPDPEPIDQISAASIRYRVAIGPHSGQRTLTIHNPALIRQGQTTKPLTANLHGFSLNAAVACKPHQRERFERLVRYVTRPAICLDRLSLRNDGQVQYELQHPYRDGTTHVLFSATDFISKLAALIPRPRHHLVRYHGVLAPNARLRALIIPAGKKQKKKHQIDDRDQKPIRQEPTAVARLSWAERLKRVFDIDISLCPRCGGRLRVIAEITDPAVIRTILDHVARSPPISGAVR